MFLKSAWNMLVFTSTVASERKVQMCSKVNRFFVLIFCVIVLFVFSGCSSMFLKSHLIKSEGNYDGLTEMAAVDDIDGWDISINEVASVSIVESNSRVSRLDFDEGVLLLNAFNAIRNSEILEVTDYFYGGVAGRVVIKTVSGEEITIGYEPICVIGYKDRFYHTSYQVKYYDIIRNLSLKYKFRYVDWEEFFLSHGINNGYAAAEKNHLIIDPAKEINEVRTDMGKSKILAGNSSFEKILNKYSDKIMLNDVVETEDMRIKVIEIKDGHRVTAVAVEFKE